MEDDDYALYRDWLAQACRSNGAEVWSYCLMSNHAHLMAAFRYVALNPVKAKLAATAADWPWSSTPAHLRRQDDGLVTVRPLL